MGAPGEEPAVSQPHTANGGAVRGSCSLEATMSTSSIPSVHRCARYTPGHSVHWVQARRSWIDKSISELPRGEIVSMEGEVIVVANEGPLLRYRNHDVDRAATTHRPARSGGCTPRK